MFKKTARLIGCFALLFAGTRADAQLMGLTEEEYIEKYGVSPVTGEKVEPQKPRPASADDKKPAAALTGRLGELQNRSVLASCIPLPIHKAVLQGGVRMEECTQLRGIDVIGYWDGTGRSARWKVSVPRPGNYEMVVSYSFLHLNDGNKQFRIFADGQTRHWSTIPSRPSHYPATSSIIRPAFNLSSGDHWVGIEALSPNYSTLFLLDAYLIPENICPPGTIVLYPASAESLQRGSSFHDATTHFLLGGRFDKPGDGLLWNADIPETGDYLIEIEYASWRHPKGRRVKLAVQGRNDQYWTLQPTGPANASPRPFKTQMVDAVSLSKGKQRIAFVLDEEGPGVLNLFQIRLIPVDNKTAPPSGGAVSFPSASEKGESGSSHAQKPPVAEEQQADKDFPELHEPVPYLHILQNRALLVEKQRKSLQARFVAALQKLRDKSVKENNFAAVARIHALIVHTEQGGATPPPADLPPNLQRAFDAYQFRKDKMLHDEKLQFLNDLETMQKSLVALNDFDQVAKIQAFVEKVRAQAPEQVFSMQSASGAVTYMPGTWVNKNKDGSPKTIIVIRPDGTCSRYECVPGTKEPSVLKKITYSQWGSFTVRKIDENVFQFFSFNGPIGTFSFLDKDTFSMPYNGPGIHTRASKQDKPYRLEE